MSAPAERLAAWLTDAQLLNRLGTPHYANPGELKADIRTLLAEVLRLRDEIALCHSREGSTEVEADW